MTKMFTDTFTITSIGMAKEEAVPVPIRTLTNQYLIYAENIAEMSPDTLPSKRSYLNDFAEYFTEYLVREITNGQLDEYFIHLKERTSALTKRKLSVESVNNRKRTVFVFLKWCKEYQGIPIRINLTKIKIKRGPDKHRKILALDDILFVIDRITNRQDRLIVRLTFEAGLRISEVASVKIDHLNGRRLEVVGKGRKRRVTFISRELVEELYSWMEDKGWHGGYIFRPLRHGKSGEGYHHLDSIRRRIQYWFKLILGIEMSPHQLRHAFARMLLDAGCNIRAIQKMLGHANIETTMIYLGVDDNWLEREYMKSLAVNQPIDN